MALRSPRWCRRSSGDIITPIISAIFGQPDFSQLRIDIGESAITYGNFLNALIAFPDHRPRIFMIVKANRMTGPKAVTTTCPFCKTDISVDATRCPNCASQLEGASA